MRYSKNGSSSDVIPSNVDGLFTSQILARQDSLALPRAGRGPDFPDHLLRGGGACNMYRFHSFVFVPLKIRRVGL